MTDCWKCKSFKTCKGRSFGCLVEHLCTKPYTAIVLTNDMIELLGHVNCGAFESREDTP